MSFPFRCPNCQTLTEVDDQYAGQIGPCAACGKTISIPYATSVATPAKDKRTRIPMPWLITMSVLGMVTLALVLFGGLLAAFLVPSVVNVVQSDTDDCRNNLRQIAAAMLAYEREHGTLPPAYSTDANGNPTHSWRVLLLPYLGHQALYAEFRLEEPWDSQHNRKLVTQMPSVYSCPSDSGLEFGEANYVVIVGDGMLFNDKTKSTSAAIPDSAAKTVMLVEVTESHISWTSPEDIQAARISWNLNRDPKGIGSHHESGVHCAMADGTVYRFSDLLPAEHFRAMATSSGGEPVDPNDWAE